MSEKRRFSVASNIIYSTIFCQAGSLAKGVLECVMNSIDARATRVDITVDTRTLSIVDDGQGFRSREEIEKWFEVFGFEHFKSDGRVYGQFGIGRGQLFGFCATAWRTGTFKMDVDVKKHGLEYDLHENLPHAPGVNIQGSLYTPLLVSELAAFEKELTELARYALIPVTLNGRRINKDIVKEKWDHETPDAWIKITDAKTLAVYNQGVLVRSYSSYQFGCGGTVVTRPGVNLALNTARNDVLVSTCEVWKRIRKFLQAKTDDRVRTKRTRMTEGELENFAKRFAAGELTYADVSEVKLLTDIVGRGHTLASVITGAYRDVPLTIAEEGDQMGERAHTRRLAFVLSTETLERFGAENLRDLQRTLSKTFHRKENAGSWLAESVDRMRVVEDLRKAVPTLRENHDVLKNTELSKAERAAADALAQMADDVNNALRGEGIIGKNSARRKVWLGASDVSEAWTDGRSKIVVERRQLQLMNLGIGGFVGLGNLLVHEYLHDSSDVGSHTHDHQFYSRYHEATCSRAGVLNQVVYRGLRKWVIALHESKLKVPATIVKHLDAIEKLIREAGTSED